MDQRTFKNVNNYFHTNIYTFSETSGGQSSNLYLNVVHFLTPVLIRHLWQLNTVVFMHWCLIHAVLFPSYMLNFAKIYFELAGVPGVAQIIILK
jgi:hypothetical protein